MAKDSPSARTKRFFEKGGYIVANAEHLNAWVGPLHMKCSECGKNKIGIKQDMFGFADHLVFHPDIPGTMLVQSTSGAHHAIRRAKILANERAYKWIKQPDRCIVVVSWSRAAKKNKDGKSAKVKPWKERIEILDVKDFAK